MSTETEYLRSVLMERDAREAESKIERAKLEAEAADAIARQQQERAMADSRERVRRGAWLNQIIAERVAQGATELVDPAALEGEIPAEGWPQGDGPERHAFELACADNPKLADADVRQCSMAEWATRYGIEI